MTESSKLIQYDDGYLNKTPIFQFMVLYSPAATAVALMPIGVSLGLPAEVLIGLIPATCAVFIIPGGAQISCVAFDRTGTTKIGRFGFNHSYLIPGLVSMAASTVLSLAIAYIIF